MSAFFSRLRDKIVDVQPDELRALALAFFFNFVVLGSYYILRPIRDDIGAAGGLENLSWMYLGTLTAMIIANALFSAIVARMSRRRFIPIAYRFFILNLALFYLAMRFLPSAQQFQVGLAFFVWVSVFNLFVVSVFWAFMSDLFNSEQGKRLFGFISVGGTLGGIVGALVTASLVKKIGTLNLLIVSAVMLEAGARCVKFFPTSFCHPAPRTLSGSRDAVALPSRKLSLHSSTPKAFGARDDSAEKPVGGGIISGISHAFRSPYLLGICGFMLLHSITSTIVYFQQADLTAHQFHDRAARTAFFAQVDLSVNVLTILVQIFLTGRLLKWLGVGITLAFLPVVSIIGFLAMGFAPALGLLAAFQTLRRAGNFAVTRPAREVLFTVLRREDKYKAKSFIDTFVYRAGDQIGAWSYPLLIWFGLGITGISFVAASLAVAWCVMALWLGRKQSTLGQDRFAERDDAAAPA